MKKIYLFLAVLSLTTLMSCSSNSPEGVTKNFFNALGEADFEKAKEYCDEPTARLIGMMGGMLDEEKKEELKKNNKGIDVIGSEISEDGNSAVVTYKSEPKDGEEAKEQTIDTKKIDGDWKVSMNKEDMKK